MNASVMRGPPRTGHLSRSPGELLGTILTLVRIRPHAGIPKSPDQRKSRSGGDAAPGSIRRGPSPGDGRCAGPSAGGWRRAWRSRHRRTGWRSSGARRRPASGPAAAARPACRVPASSAPTRARAGRRPGARRPRRRRTHGCGEIASWMTVAASGRQERQCQRRDRVAAVARRRPPKNIANCAMDVMMPATPAATDDVRMSRL